MSIATAITNLTNTIRGIASTKQDIKSAVNEDFETINNEQIEQYPNLIRNAIERYKGYIPTVKQEGKQISLNTVPLKAKEFALIGDTFQQQYEGKNLFDYAGSKLELAQLDFVRMKIASSASIILSYIQCKPNTIYTISRRSPMSIRFQVGTTENEPVVGEPLLSAEVFNDNTTTSTTITTPANANYIIVRFIYNETTDYETYAKTIQIEEGSTATEYEPYVGGTASPNPDYPQNIKVVTGNQTVVIRGKNLFNENSEWNINSSVGMGGTSQGEFPYSSGGNRYTYFFKSKPNTTYTVSSKTKCDRLGIFEHYTEINPLEYSGNNKLTLDNMIIGLNKDIPNSYTFTTNENTKMVAIYYSLNTLPEDFQILETDLIRELPLSLGNMELCKTEEDKDILFKNTINSEYYNSELEEGSWYKKSEINKKTYNGTEYWSTMQSYQGFNRIPITVSGMKNAGNLRKLDILCTHFHASDINGYNIIFHYGSQIYIYPPEEITTRDDFLDLLAEITPTLYYPLATPTYTKITDETLINQLEAIENTNMNDGTTIIYAENEEGLQPTLYVEAYKKEAE